MRIPFLEVEDGEPLSYGPIRHWIWFHLIRPVTQWFWRTIGCPRAAFTIGGGHGDSIAYCPQCGYMTEEAYW